MPSPGRAEPSLRHDLLGRCVARVAIEKLGEQSFDLVFMDVQMPVMDGFELLAHIASNHPTIPVIVMTAFGTMETAVEAFRHGAVDFLPRHGLKLCVITGGLRAFSGCDGTEQGRRDLIQIRKVYRMGGKVDIDAANRAINSRPRKPEGISNSSTAGMIRWPAQIKPGVTNEMVSVHDFLPTLAGFIGADVPADRPYDGFDQGDFLLDAGEVG